MGEVHESGGVNIFLNGQPLVTSAQFIADLIEAQALAGMKVATALNGSFVPEAQRATTPLKPGDRIEIVSPRQGG
jgi:sulfur carrier protein